MIIAVINEGTCVPFRSHNWSSHACDQHLFDILVGCIKIPKDLIPESNRAEYSEKPDQSVAHFKLPQYQSTSARYIGNSFPHYVYQLMWEDGYNYPYVGVTWGFTSCGSCGMDFPIAVKCGEKKETNRHFHEWEEFLEWGRRPKEEYLYLIYSQCELSAKIGKIDINSNSGFYSGCGCSNLIRNQAFITEYFEFLALM